MSPHRLLVIVSAIALAPACLDEEVIAGDGEPRVEAARGADLVVDEMYAGSVPPPVVVAQRLPGEQCAEHADCDSELGAGDGYCYRGDVGGSLVFPDEGYCTIDDGSGEVCAVDDDCPGTSRCASIDGYRLCLPACGEDDACPSGQACQGSFGGMALDMSVCLPGDAAARDGDACTGFFDCNASSTCWSDAEHPGGYCSAYSCTLGTNEGCNGGVCIEFRDGPSTGTVCVASCAVDADCRADEGYVCHDPDGAGAEAAYCRRPHVGDACESSADCGEGWTCLTGEEWPGGYCTANECPVPGTTEGCGSGAICTTLGEANVCVDRCAAVGSESTCRDGYTCAAVGAVNGGACLAP